MRAHSSFYAYADKGERLLPPQPARLLPQAPAALLFLLRRRAHCLCLAVR